MNRLAGHSRRRAPGPRRSTSSRFWSPEFDTLYAWVPKIVGAADARCPGLVDVSNDREQGGLQANITIDRQAAARLGVRIQDIDNALNNAFAQRQISTIYTQRNQYRIDPRGRPALPARSRRTCRASSCPAATARRCRSPA